MVTIELVRGPLDGEVKKVRRLQETLTVKILQGEGTKKEKEVKYEYRRTGRKTKGNNHEYALLRRPK